MRYAIETEGLVKRFKYRLAVDSLHLRIPENSIFGLVGENGAGKTTTLSMIAGLMKPTLGSVKILGEDVRKSDVIKKEVGCALQNCVFDPNRKIVDLMHYYALLKGIPKDKVRDECHRIIKKVYLEPHMEKKVRELSHGMVKMLAVGQALLGDPKVVLLDEPASGLDPKIYHELKGIIKELGKEKTVVMTTHNLDFVTELCDYVAIMHGGKLMIQDKVKKLVRGKTLEKVFLDLIEKR